MNTSTPPPAPVPPAEPDPANDGAGAGVLPPDEAVEWFASLFEPLAALALARGVRLTALIDSLKLALVRAAVALPDDDGAVPVRSDSKLAVMTGVHRKDLRRIRTTGVPARVKSLSLVGEVFARWQTTAPFASRPGAPVVLLRQPDASGAPDFEGLVQSVTRDVHPRPVLDEMLRLGLVETEGETADRVRLVQTAYVPTGDIKARMQLAHDNLADHVAAIAGNLAGDGHRFLEQAVYSDELTAASALAFNRETARIWQAVFEQVMPKLIALHEADRQSTAPRDHRVRLGLYGLAIRDHEKDQ